MEQTKQCVACHQFKPVTEFHSSGRYTRGDCKTCKNSDACRRQEANCVYKNCKTQTDKEKYIAALERKLELAKNYIPPESSSDGENQPNL